MATGCPFAIYVVMAFSNAAGSSSADGPFTITSPTTGTAYHVTCIDGEAQVVCSTGGSIAVRFADAVVTHGVVTIPSQTPAPTPSTAPTSTEDVGSSSHADDATFCASHDCIGSFSTEPGYIVECSDGTYSHSGGISGSCSRHGGNG